MGNEKFDYPCNRHETWSDVCLHFRRFLFVILINLLVLCYTVSHIPRLIGWKLQIYPTPNSFGARALGVFFGSFGMNWLWIDSFLLLARYVPNVAKEEYEISVRIPFMFGSRVGFSGTADRTAPFPVGSNSRWRPAAILENFKRSSQQSIMRFTVCMYTDHTLPSDSNL